MHRIHTFDSRWWVSGRCLKMEIAKAEYGLPHWERLTVGEKLPNVLIDWTSWIDEAEEREVRGAGVSEIRLRRRARGRRPPQARLRTRRSWRRRRTRRRRP